MDITSLHKYIALNKITNGDTEVLFAGQPCLVVNENMGKQWKISPVFAKLTYGANVFEDIPVCMETFESDEDSIAAGLTKLWEIGAFTTCVDLPEDTYAATLAYGLGDAKEQIGEDYTRASMEISPSLFEASTARKKLAKLAKGDADVSISETVENEIFEKLKSGTELTQAEMRIVIESQASGSKAFVDTKTGLFIGSKMKMTEYVPPVVQEKVEEIVEAPKVSAFSAFKSKQAVVPVTESRKLLATHSKGTKTAKVYKDSETDEHVVKFYEGGKHQTEADYFTSGDGAKDDAHGTAKSYINGKFGQANEGFNDDDYYKVHKASKKVVKSLGKLRVPFSNHPENDPVLKRHCDDEHTCLKGMQAKHQGYILANEQKESEFNANLQMSGDNKTTTAKKIKLKSPSGSVVSTHDTEADAVRAFKALPNSKGHKIESVQGDVETDITDTFLTEMKDADAEYAKWMADVKTKHAGKDLKFKGRVEKGVHTTSAEESGKDRSYGVWDHKDNTGHIFEDEGTEIVGEEKSEKAEEKQIATALKKDHKFVSKRDDGTRSKGAK